MNFFKRTKNLLRIFFICLLLLLFVSAVCAQVHIQSTCYNSEAMVTESVMTNNADYSSVTVLLPYSGYAGLPFSIRSNGAGKSVDKEFSEFSHSIYAGNCENFENIEASLKTESESGGFEWKGGVTVSSYGLSMGMSVGGGIENGTLEAFYRNSLSKHTEEVTANGAQYSVATSITPDTITSNGIGKGGEGLKEVEKESVSEDNGATEEESDSKEDKGSEDNGANEGDTDGEKGRESGDESANEGSGLDKQKNEKDEGDEHEADINENPGENTDNVSEHNGGFFHKTGIEGQGKWAEITTNLTCDPTNTGYEWKKSAITVTQNSSLGMTVEGVSKNGSLKTIEMDGEASKFPHLHLPPGEVVITTVESESENNYQEDISEAANDFYGDFSENPTVLYYKIEQECSIPAGDGGISQSQDSGIGSEEYFRLSMSFNVEQKGNG